MAKKKFTVKASQQKSVKSATRKPLRKQAIKADWVSKGKKQKVSKSFELDNFFLFELCNGFIGISINESYPNGIGWSGARTVTCDDAKGLFTYLQKNLTEDATWNQIERTIAKSGFDVKIDDMGGFISDKNMRKPAKSVDSACSKKKSVKASDVDADRPNSAPNSWKSSQRMAYKVTEDQTKGERTFPTSIDDVYKVLGEMQGTWTNPTTGWTGDCEIYERDLDDGSYIFSLVFGGNELEPDDILYDPNGFDYYSNKPKFTIYPHSGAPTFADSIEDFKRKLKKEYSYLRKVDDVNSACGKKKTVKASASAKRRASKRAITCAFDEGDPWEYQESYDYYYDEEPPKHIAKELERLAKLTDMYQDRWFEKFEELHPGERFSSVDPHPDVDEAVGYTLDEAEYSPDDIKASISEDELEPIMGDDFNDEDMGYGFDTSGEAISESMVDELCRIANEILDESELAKLGSWTDIDRDSFDYWCDGSSYVSEKFTITFTYTSELMTFNDFVKEDAWWTPSAEHGLGFNIQVKDGQVESVEYTDKYWVGNSTPLENAESIFDIERLEAYIAEIAAPVAMEIYNGTTNI